MTWKELITRLESRFTEEQLDTDVTVYLSHQDEFYAVTGVFQTSENDVLDAYHPYLEIPA